MLANHAAAEDEDMHGNSHDETGCHLDLVLSDSVPQMFNKPMDLVFDGLGYSYRNRTD